MECHHEIKIEQDEQDPVPEEDQVSTEERTTSPDNTTESTIPIEETTEEEEDTIQEMRAIILETSRRTMMRCPMCRDRTGFDQCRGCDEGRTTFMRRNGEFSMEERKERDRRPENRKCPCCRQQAVTMKALAPRMKMEDPTDKPIPNIDVWGWK
jgi:hypothetical protein